MAQTNANNSPKGETNPNFSQEQYDMLKRCSDKKDMTEWNRWREDNPREKIFLEGANLLNVNLSGANLSRAYLREAKFHYNSSEQVNFSHADLIKADFLGTPLKGANFYNANLQGCTFFNAYLQSTKYVTAIVDGSTLFWHCEVDRETNFNGVGLKDVRIEPRVRQILERNLRRMNWERWYKQHRWLQWPVLGFWKMSDYGISTIRIIIVFFALALIFGTIYYAWGVVDLYVFQKEYPGIVKNLFVIEDQEAELERYKFIGNGLIELQEGKAARVPEWLVPWRAIYFSIVTMTTLGFGDIYASARYFWRGWFGHILLMFQVLLGYFLLGALVTRFAIMFTAGGPAWDFAERKNEKAIKK